MIDDYHFGSITIDGRIYNHDVEVRWSGEVLSWIRSESQIIDTESIKRAIVLNPGLIIIGTGDSGMAKVLKETKQEILSKGIGLVIAKTAEAKDRFNEAIKENRKVIALLHITC